MPEIQIRVQLSERRNQSGVMSVFVKHGLIAQFQVLGRGSRGPGDTQMSVNGNTPTGEYEISRIVDTTGWSQTSYGPNGALRLKPTSGNALAAEKNAGRKGLLIHGGSAGGAGYWRGSGELRATHGCLRLANEDVRRLIDSIWQESVNDSKFVCEPVRVSVSVTDHPMSFQRPD